MQRPSTLALARFPRIPAVFSCVGLRACFLYVLRVKLHDHQQLKRTNMEIVDRKTAATRGEITFFTGKPCRKGHVSPRYVSTGHCVDCVKGHAVEYRRDVAALRAPVRLPVVTEGMTYEQAAARIERDAADDITDKLEALDRAHVAAVARLKADTQLAKDNARAASARAVRVALATLADAMAANKVRDAERAEREALAAQQQAERNALAAKRAARDEFKSVLRKCRAKIAAEHVATADAYVWAVAMARCEEVEQADVCRGADREFAGVQGYLVHPDDVAATMEALKAYAPPSVILPPVPEVPSDTSSSDWLHK